MVQKRIETSHIIKHENSNEIRFMPFEATFGLKKNSPHEYSLYFSFRKPFWCASVYQVAMRIVLFCAVRNTQQPFKEHVHWLPPFHCLCVDGCLTTCGHPKDCTWTTKSRIFPLNICQALKPLNPQRGQQATKVYHGPPLPQTDSLLCLRKFWDLCDLWGLWWFWRFHLYTASHSQSLWCCQQSANEKC